MHPEFLQRLREEILSIVGSSRNPTYDDLKDMKFLRAVINGEFSNPWTNPLIGNPLYAVTETMRLYPPVYVEHNRLSNYHRP